LRNLVAPFVIEVRAVRRPLRTLMETCLTGTTQCCP
jgi:hypothetical protein